MLRATMPAAARGQNQKQELARDSEYRQARRGSARKWRAIPITLLDAVSGRAPDPLEKNRRSSGEHRAHILMSEFSGFEAPKVTHLTHFLRS